MRQEVEWGKVSGKVLFYSIGKKSICTCITGNSEVWSYKDNVKYGFKVYSWIARLEYRVNKSELYTIRPRKNSLSKSLCYEKMQKVYNPFYIVYNWTSFCRGRVQDLSIHKIVFHSELGKPLFFLLLEEVVSLQRGVSK